MTSTPVRERPCKDSRLLGAYLDGELDPSSLIDVETHLSACETCRERVEVDRATRQSLKRVVRAETRHQGTGSLAALRARTLNAMIAERARSEVRTFESEEKNRMLGWRTMVPLASAAALALFWGASSRVSDVGLQNDSMRAGAVGYDLIDEFIHEHSDSMPPQFTDPRDVRNLDRYVGVSVRPHAFERDGASFVGARVLPYRQQRIAQLQYLLDSGAAKQRISVFIYPPGKITITAPGLATREIDNHKFRVGQENGYSIADTQDRGVGYTLVSDDIDPEQSAKLAALAMQTQ